MALFAVGRWGRLFVTVAIVGAACGPSGGEVMPAPTDVAPVSGAADADVVVEVGEWSLLLGGVEAEGVSVLLPAGAFEVGTRVWMSIDDAGPGGLADGVRGLGAVTSLGVEDGVARSWEPMTVTFSFPPQSVAEQGELWVGYHHPTDGWSLWPPDSVDLAGGRVEVSVHHFSSYALLQADEAVRVDQFLERRAVEGFVRRDAEARSEAQIAAMVESILREGMDVGDSQIIEIIVRGVVEQVPFGSVGLALYDSDIEALVEATLDTTMDLVAKNADEDGAAAEWAGEWSTLKAFVDAAREASDGDYEAALRVMANEIIDNTPVVSHIKTIGAVAVQVADHVITDLWLTPEVEKAFRAYRDGAEGGRFGYDVDPRDWEQLAGQMRGVFARIRADHLALHCTTAGIDCAALSDAERNRIGDQGMELLRERFADRIARQDEIERAMAVEADLFGYLSERGWLARSFSNPMYSGAEGEDLDALLRRLGMMIERIKADTGRVNLVLDVDYDAADPHDRIDQRLLPAGAIEPLLRAWYLSPPAERAEAYRAALIELGLVGRPSDTDDQPEADVDLGDPESDDTAVMAAALRGTWSGTLTSYDLDLFDVGPEETRHPFCLHLDLDATGEGLAHLALGCGDLRVCQELGGCDHPRAWRSPAQPVDWQGSTLTFAVPVEEDGMVQRLTAHIEWEGTVPLSISGSITTASAWPEASVTFTVTKSG